MSQNTADTRTELKSLEGIMKEKINRDYVEEILESFAKCERSALLDKEPVIMKYLSKICGNVKANILLDIVSKSAPAVDEVLKQFEDPETRDWAEKLNRRFVPVYEGLFPPFPHDWYRIRWSTRLDTTLGNLPFIATRILKRNGETVYLDQPFPAAVKLMTHQLRQMKAFQKRIKAPPGLGIEQVLKELNSVINSILEGSPEKDRKRSRRART